MRMNSSQSAASGPRRSSGRSFRSRAARATSNRPIERSVPFTVKRPSAKATSAGSVSSTWPAIFVAFWITACDALPMTTPPIRIERAECEPPPIGTMSVSPWISLMRSTSTPSHSPTHCAKLVSWPWPLDSVPIETSTRPSGFTSTFDHSRGEPLVISR